MIKFITMIAGWFTQGGAISALFTWLGVKFTSKSFIIGIQITTVALLFSARAGFLWAVLEASRLTLNALIHFFEILPTMLTSDTTLSLAYDVFRAFGITDAFMDAFSIFNVLFVSILTAWFLKFAYHTAKTTSDEFFKLGMLLQA